MQEPSKFESAATELATVNGVPVAGSFKVARIEAEEWEAADELVVTKGSDEESDEDEMDEDDPTPQPTGKLPKQREVSAPAPDGAKGSGNAGGGIVSSCAMAVT